MFELVKQSDGDTKPGTDTLDWGYRCQGEYFKPLQVGGALGHSPVQKKCTSAFNNGVHGKIHC